MPSSNYVFERKCLFCGCVFTAKTIDSRYCSTTCSRKASIQKAQEEERMDILKKNRMLKSQNVNPETMFLKVSEASAVFGVSKDTIRRMLKKGLLTKITCGMKITRIERTQLEKFFGMKIDKAKEDILKPQKEERKYYSIEQDNSYTIGEIQKKFNVSEKTVYTHIRRFSIPIRQIGKYVYAPKTEIDKMYEGIKTREL